MPSQGSALHLLAKARINLYLDAKPQGTLFVPPSSYTKQNHRFIMQPRESNPDTEPIFNSDVIFPVERYSHYASQQFAQYELPVLTEDSNLQYVDDVLNKLVEYVEIRVDHRQFCKINTQSESFLRARRENTEQNYNADAGQFATEEERLAFSRGEGGRYKGFCRPLRFEISGWWQRWLSHALPMCKVTRSRPYIVMHLRPFTAVVERINKLPGAEIHIPVAPRMEARLLTVWYTVPPKQYEALKAEPEHQYLSDLTDLVKEVSITASNMKGKMRYTAVHPHTQHLMFFQHAAHREGNRPLASYIPVRWTTDVNRYHKAMPFELVNPRLNEASLHRCPPDEYLLSRFATGTTHRNIYCSKDDSDAKPAVLTYCVDPDNFAPSGAIAFPAVAHNYQEYRLKGCSRVANPLMGDASRALFLTPVQEQKFRLTFTIPAQEHTDIPMALGGIYVDIQINADVYERVLLTPVVDGDLTPVDLDTLGVNGAVVDEVPVYDPKRFMEANATTMTNNGTVAEDILFIPAADEGGATDVAVFTADIALKTLDATILPHTVCVTLSTKLDDDPVTFPAYMPAFDADDLTEDQADAAADGTWGHTNVRNLKIKCQPHHEIDAVCPWSDVPYRRNKPIAGGYLSMYARFRVPVVVVNGTMVRIVGGDERSS